MKNNNCIFLCDNPNGVQNVFGKGTPHEVTIEGMSDKTVWSKDDILKNGSRFGDTEYIFSTWGMPCFTEDEISQLFPSLKCVFYAAGSVQNFARPFLNCGVRVFSAWAANAVPVAEYTVAQIILAMKGFFVSSRLAKSDREESKRAFSQYPGVYGEKVGIIGAGMIGKLVIRQLTHLGLECLVFDPFLSDNDAVSLGVVKCGLETLFRDSFVVSNHLANNEQTKGILTGRLFSLMRRNAVFINTGRRAQVAEDEFVSVLEQRPDITALLDVTYPEPPVPGHRFYSLDNCILTPHIAGSSGNEVRRMARFMAEEYGRFTRSEPCLYEITLKMLETMS